MANANKTPQRDVKITRGFWLDVTEVTNRSFDNFASSGGYRDRSWWSDAGWDWKGGREGPDSPPRDGALDAERPRVWITWFEAEAYAHWRAGRLPSEAEWEYAARGPTPRVYPWGDSWDAERAWTNVTSPTLADRVGLRPLGRSWRGADNLAGNV